MANNFLVSVADAILRNPTTLETLAIGKANINSAFNITMQNTDVRGGIGNPLLYSFYHDRMVELSIESAIFSKSILALNAGATVTNGALTCVKQEDIVLVADDGTLSETPLGNVSVVLPNGTIQTVTPVGTTITVSGGGAQKVTAIYTYTDTVDYVVGSTTEAPTIVDLILIAEVKDNTGLVERLQIHVPRFQISGNYSLAMTANGVSTETLDGKALEVTSTTTDPNYYYRVAWIPVSTASIAVSSIAITPTVLTFDTADLPKSKQANLLGIRGGTYANANITTSASWIRTSGCTTFNIGAATGIVSACATVGIGDAALFTATYYDATSGSLTDTFSAVGTA
jgi:hypothetical protein